MDIHRALLTQIQRDEGGTVRITDNQRTTFYSPKGFAAGLVSIEIKVLNQPPFTGSG